jgi:hypothetical protein
VQVTSWKKKMRMKKKTKIVGRCARGREADSLCPHGGLENPPSFDGRCDFFWAGERAEYICSFEHMTETDLKRRLRESQESRRRAWAALQGLRGVIEQLSRRTLAPPGRPPCFAAEGEVLKRSLELSMKTVKLQIDEVLAVVEAMRPHIMGNGSAGEFPHVLLRLNRAVSKLREVSGCL